MHIYICMYLCKVAVGKQYACKCIPLCASYGNVIRACTKAVLSGACTWMIVMNGNGDAWFVLVKE